MQVWRKIVKPEGRLTKVFNAACYHIAGMTLMEAMELEDKKMDLHAPYPETKALTSYQQKEAQKSIDWDHFRLLEQYGVKFIEEKLRRVTEIFERLTRRVRDQIIWEDWLTKTQDDIAINREAFLEKSFLWKKLVIIIFALLFLTIADTGFMFITLGDSMGLDTEKIQQFMENKFIVSVTFFTSLGLFIGMLLLSLMILSVAYLLYTRIVAAVCLISLGVSLACLRANEIEINDILFYPLFVIFLFVSISIPMICAMLKILLTSTLNEHEKVRMKIALLNSRRRFTSDNLQKTERKLSQVYSDYDKGVDWFRQFHQQEARKEQQKLEEQEHFERLKALNRENLKWGFAFVGRFFEALKSRSFRVVGVMILFFSIFTIVAMSISGCKGFKQHSAGKKLNVSVLCDSSSSSANNGCTPEVLGSLGNNWAHEANRGAGGKFEVFLIGSSIDDVELFFHEEYPERFPPPVSKNKAQWNRDVLKRLRKEATELPHDRGSAIVEAIFAITHRMSRGPGEVINVLVIVSDMRQVSGKLNFEQRAPSVDEFFRYLEKESLDPDLTGIEVQVCGVHLHSPEDTSPITAREFMKLKRLWAATFERWECRVELYEVCEPEYLFKERR